MGNVKTTITFINAPNPDRLYRAWAEIESRTGDAGHNGATAGNSTESPCIAEHRKSEAKFCHGSKA